MARRALCSALPFGLLVALGCGDGVGNPIRAAHHALADAAPPDLDAGPTGPDSGIERDSGASSDASVITLSSSTELVPRGRHCKPAANWPSDTSLEDYELLTLVIGLRAGDLTCSSRQAPGAAALQVTPELNCSARLHVLDMADRAFFDQINPDGLGPADRIAATGYAFGTAGEVIEQGSFSDVAEQLTGGSHSCGALLDPAFDSVGIGHLGYLWVVDLAGP